MIVDWLLDNGFKPDGCTDVTVYRGTFLGGRTRFNNGDCYVTVGKRTTCVYRKENGKIVEGENFNTKDSQQIQERIEKMIKGGN